MKSLVLTSLFLSRVLSEANGFILPKQTTIRHNKSTLCSSATQEISEELIQLLLSSKSKTYSGDRRMQELVDKLVDAKVSFDPEKCLNGPLYFSNVIEGPSPLWERIGIFSGNIQGQQYTYTDTETSVINYAEIFGSALHLRAYGTFEKDIASPLLDSKDVNQLFEEKASLPSIFDRFPIIDGVLSSFERYTRPQLSPSSKKVIRCPVDFLVNVNKASVFMGTKYILSVPIAGTGYLRVLYADPKIRIFISPISSTDDRWEKAGLKVAQVCIEMLDDEFGQLL